MLETLTTKTSPPVGMALASSAGRKLFELKTFHIPQLNGKFAKECCVFGDDPQMPGRERKPAPDSFLLAKQALDKVVVKRGERAVMEMDGGGG